MTIDHEDLLRRYIAHVYHCEGTDFVGFVKDPQLYAEYKADGLRVGPEFTLEERDELCRLSYDEPILGIDAAKGRMMRDADGNPC